MKSFDVIVIGAGPAGEVASARLGAAGLRVALVEDRLVGGECAYWACMPSKALLRPAEALAEARRVPGAAGAIDGGVQVAETLDRRDEVIRHLDDHAQMPWLQRRGIELVRGRARVTGERRVSVGDRELEARRAVVLASGSSALIPPIDGLREARPWTNVEATTARRPPDDLIVLGGGPVGAELAQAWASLGSRVTIVEALERLISKEEPFASEQVTEALRALAVRVRTGVKATRVARVDGRVHVHLDDGATVTADEILVAIGRRPNTDAVESLGFEPGEPIPVDDRLRARGHEWLYAVGDVNGRALLTHMGKYQARLVVDDILGRDGFAPNPADGPAAPRVTFTDPQVAAVGLTLAAAREQGLEATAHDAGTSENPGGSFYGRGAPGTARIVVDERRRVIIGATITGAEVADFLHAATIAIVAEVPLERLWHAVPAFPTRSELWLRLLEKARS